MALIKEVLLILSWITFFSNAIPIPGVIVPPLHEPKIHWISGGWKPSRKWPPNKPKIASKPIIFEAKPLVFKDQASEPSYKQATVYKESVLEPVEDQKEPEIYYKPILEESDSNPSFKSVTVYQKPEPTNLNRDPEIYYKPLVQEPTTKPSFKAFSTYDVLPVYKSAPEVKEPKINNKPANENNVHNPTFQEFKSEFPTFEDFEIEPHPDDKPLIGWLQSHNPAPKHNKPASSHTENPPQKTYMLKVLGEQNEKGGEKEIEQIEENAEKAISPAVDIIGIEETSTVIDGLESDGTLDIRSGFDDYDERDSREGKAIVSQKETIEGVAINKENTVDMEQDDIDEATAIAKAFAFAKEQTILHGNETDPEEGLENTSESLRTLAISLSNLLQSRLESESDSSKLKDSVKVEAIKKELNLAQIAEDLTAVLAAEEQSRLKTVTKSGKEKEMSKTENISKKQSKLKNLIEVKEAEKSTMAGDAKVPFKEKTRPEAVPKIVNNTNSNRLAFRPIKPRRKIKEESKLDKGEVIVEDKVQAVLKEINQSDDLNKKTKDQQSNKLAFRQNKERTELRSVLRLQGSEKARVEDDNQGASKERNKSLAVTENTETKRPMRLSFRPITPKTTITTTTSSPLPRSLFPTRNPNFTRFGLRFIRPLSSTTEMPPESTSHVHDSKEDLVKKGFDVFKAAIILDDKLQTEVKARES